MAEEVRQEQIDAPDEREVNRAAASLAFATHLQQQFLQPEQQEQPEKPTNAPGSVLGQEDKVQPEKEQKALTNEIKGIKKDIEEIKGMLKTDEKTEIEDLKKQIKDVLKDGTDES